MTLFSEEATKCQTLWVLREGKTLFQTIGILNTDVTIYTYLRNPLWTPRRPLDNLLELHNLGEFLPNFTDVASNVQHRRLGVRNERWVLKMAGHTSSTSARVLRLLAEEYMPLVSSVVEYSHRSTELPNDPARRRVVATGHTARGNFIPHCLFSFLYISSISYYFYFIA